MKNTPIKILLLLILAAVLGAQETVAPGPYNVRTGDLKLFTTSNETRLVIDSGPTYLTFQCGIRVNCKTGEVDIPDGLKLDDASRKFWLSLADNFVGVREAWAAGYLAAKK